MPLAPTLWPTSFSNEGPDVVLYDLVSSRKADLLFRKEKQILGIKEYTETHALPRIMISLLLSLIGRSKYGLASQDG